MDLKDARLIYLKGFLFLGLGIAATTLLLLEHPNLRVALLLAIAVWGFCRFYYFAFYVITHYVDDRFKFAGLLSFVEYLCTGHAVPHGRTAGSAENVAQETQDSPTGDRDASRNEPPQNS